MVSWLRRGKIQNRQRSCVRQSNEPFPFLSSRLKNLEEHGIVERKFYSAHPPRAEYLLTRKGHELGVVAGALAVWGSRHTKGEIELIHDDCGKSVEVIYQCGSCEGPVPRSRVRLEQPRAS